MGCFNTIGSISRIPIYYQEDIALIICYLDNETNFAETIHSQYKFQTSYIPLAPAVYGTYNEYGSIEDIVKDANVNCLEEITGYPIDKIIEIIDDHVYNNQKYIFEYPELCKAFGLKPNAEIFYVIEHKNYFKTLCNLKNYWLFNESYDISKDNRNFMKDEYDRFLKKDNVQEISFELFSEIYQHEYLKLFDFGKTRHINMNPDYEDSVFGSLLVWETIPKKFMNIYQNHSEMLWRDGMKESFCEICNLMYSLESLQLELLPSRYARQEHNDKDLKGVLECSLRIINIHIQEDKELENNL